MGKKKPEGNPWTAARARVWYLDGLWHYSVTNWWGKVVMHDMAGGAKGRQAIFTAAAKAVAAVRLMDGSGQGKHLKARHIQYLSATGRLNLDGMAEDTWPNLRQWHRRGFNKERRERVWRRIILAVQPKANDNGVYRMEVA